MAHTLDCPHTHKLDCPYNHTLNCPTQHASIRMTHFPVMTNPVVLMLPEGTTPLIA